MSISDPLFLNNSIATSASLLQNQSTSTSCKFILLSLTYVKNIKKTVKFMWVEKK